jgi:dihydropteroate synthase
MGVLNVTPDSFSDGGRFLASPDAIAHGRAMAAEGADWIDVGGESTRPGAAPVPAEEQLARVIPVIEALAAEGLRVSIDTRSEPVARAAVAAGATLINDVSASLGAVAADLGVAWAAMHAQGDPATMQLDPTYDDVVAEVLAHLVARADAARAAGVPEVWIDPGIGFGKTDAHNLRLLAHLDAFVATGLPVLVGTSRKGFLGRLLGASDGTDAPADVDDRLEGSLATATWAMTCGAAMVRAHDVRATAQAARVLAAEITEERAA